MNPQDFDFMMNNQPAKGPSFLRSAKQRNIAIIAFIVGFLCLILLAFSFLTSGPSDAEKLIPLNLRQKNLLVVLEERKQISDSDKLDDYTTLYYSVLSDSQASSNYLNENKVVIKPEVAAQYSYPDMEADLKTAEEVNRLEEELQDYITKAINDYTSELSSFQAATERQQSILGNAKEHMIEYLGE